MPMEKGILGMVVQHLPPPSDSQEGKLSVICPALLSSRPPRSEEEYQQVESSGRTLEEDWNNLRASVLHCKRDADTPSVAYVTKMQPVSSRLYDIVTRS